MFSIQYFKKLFDMLFQINWLSIIGGTSSRANETPPIHLGRFNKIHQYFHQRENDDSNQKCASDDIDVADSMQLYSDPWSENASVYAHTCCIGVMLSSCYRIRALANKRSRPRWYVSPSLGATRSSLWNAEMHPPVRGAL